MRRRSFERLIFPAVLTVVLFTVYLPFSNKPLMVPAFGDVTRYVEFGAFTALIFFAVRLVDVLIFDVAVARRREVAAPQLLRGIVAIVLYVLLFAALFQQVLNYDVKSFITGTAVLAAVLALALQETLGNLFAGIALHMEETYEIGDVIHSGDYMGVVEGVSWRATRIRGTAAHRQSRERSADVCGRVGTP